MASRQEVHFFYPGWRISFWIWIFCILDETSLAISNFSSSSSYFYFCDFCGFFLFLAGLFFSLESSSSSLNLECSSSSFSCLIYFFVLLFYFSYSCYSLIHSSLILNSTLPISLISSYSLLETIFSITSMLEFWKSF